MNTLRMIWSSLVARASHVGIALAVGAMLSASGGAFAQAVGDFNGDGFADLAIGVSGENLNGQANAGAVHVLYGSGSRLAAAGAQFWHLDRPGVPDETDNNDRFGSALAVGDFDNDGFDDLAIGIPGKRIGSDEDAGAVLVLFGSETGLATDDAEFWHQDVAGVMDGSEFNDRFGDVLAAGDFDGDGFDDLAIGVPGERSDFGIAAGAVNVLHGRGTGLSATDDQFFQQGLDGLPGIPEGGDEFGSALAAGDFNNDGRDDLAIGVSDESHSGADQAGLIHVLFGAEGGLTTGGSQMWSQDFAGIPDEPEDDDSFGASLAAGDFNNDGFDDLAIGVPEEEIGSVEDAGGVLVLYGSSLGLRAANSQFWTQNSQGIRDQCEHNDHFGHALVAGDFNGDGFDDLAIGVAGEAIAGRAQAGAVNVLFGSASRLRAAGNEFWHQNVASVLDRCEFEDRFGTTLAAGDFDNDGRDDLAVGVPFENVGASNAGAVHVFYGANRGLRAGPDQFWHQNRPGIVDACETGDGFGGGNAP